MDGCDCLEDIYGWNDCLECFLWVGVTGCGWVSGCEWLGKLVKPTDILHIFIDRVWVGVTGCGWVGKMVKPNMNVSKHEIKVSSFCTMFNLDGI